MNSLSKSKRDYYSLEITTVLGCSVNCMYCPQSALSQASRDVLNKVLTFDNFKKYLSNVPKNVHIHWTGYSEPCLIKDLDKMITHVHEKGHSQLISTTLEGNSKSADFVSRFPFFKSFTLHLPDSHGLMKGIANKKGYLERVLKLFPYIYDINKEKLDLLTFGKQFHPDIESLIKFYKEKNINLKVERRDHLHERAGQVDTTKIDDLEKFVGKHENNSKTDKENKFSFRTNSELKLKENIDKKFNSNEENLNNWFCSYKRLSQPVLLPDGRTNICCQDYQLSCITGDLSSQSYEDLVKYENIKEKFFSGKLNPCIKCEYYKRL